MFRGYREPEVIFEERLENSGCLDVKGFGTFDLLKILNLLKLAGIDLKDFSCENREKRTDACVRTLTLMHFAKYNNYDLDSLPEYIQRVTGKDVKTVSFADYIAVLRLKADERDVVPPGAAILVNAITGKIGFSEAGLSEEDVGELRKAFAALRKPDAAPTTVKALGKTLTLERLPDGGVRASLKTGENAGDFKLCRFAQKAEDIARAIDDIVIANAKDYAKDLVLSVLPSLPDHRQGDSLIRAREVYAKIICSFNPQCNPVDFASVPTATLRQMAVDAVEKKKLPPLDATPQTFNSAEMIEMHRNMAGLALAEVDKKDTMGLLLSFMRDFIGRMGTTALAIRENKRFADKFEARKDFAIATLEERNDNLGEDLRLTKTKRRILMRKMETFAWPFGGAWTEQPEKGAKGTVERIKVVLPKDKWDTFIEALEVNLNDLKIALGFDARAKLPPEIAGLAVTYLAQIDPRVALAVKSLTEDEYNALLAGLGKNPAADMLGAAIEALKKAPGDAELFAYDPDAQTDFAEIDAAADRIDPSPGNILEMGMNFFRKGQ